MNERQIRINIPWYVHKELKIRAAEEGISIKALVLKALLDNGIISSYAD